MNLLSLLVMIAAALGLFYDGLSRPAVRLQSVALGVFVIGVIFQLTLFPHDIVGRL